MKKSPVSPIGEYLLLRGVYSLRDMIYIVRAVVSLVRELLSPLREECVASSGGKAVVKANPLSNL